MIWRLIKVAAVILLIVVVIGKLPNRTVTNCTAHVTADDGSVRDVPC